MSGQAKVKDGDPRTPVAMPKVLNARRFGTGFTDTREYVGRPSDWGNPFEIGTHGTRAEVIQKYENYLRSQPRLMSRLGELRGKDLVCWCSPKRCHADILLALANANP